MLSHVELDHLFSLLHGFLRNEQTIIYVSRLLLIEFDRLGFFLLLLLKLMLLFLCVYFGVQVFGAYWIYNCG